MRPLFALLALAAWAVPAPAQETASDTLLTVQHYLDMEQVGDPQISPDGSQIVFTRGWVNQQEDRWESGIWIMQADGSRARFVVKGSAPRWSPDGTRILYLAAGEPKGTQIHVRWMDAEGAITQVTRLPSTPVSVRWSPDGRTISFAMFVRDPESWTIAMPSAPSGATWTAAPRIVRSLHYRQDRRGFMERGFVHLFLVPADGGTERQLTRGAWNVGARFDYLESGVGHDWTPDGRFIVFDGLRDSLADWNYRNSHLYVLTVADGAIRQLTTRPGSWGDPHVSPDGRLVAFTGIDSARHSYAVEPLHVIGLDGSGMRTLTAGLDRDPGGLTWAPDGSGLYFTAADRGTANVHFAALRGAVRAVTSGTHLVSLTSMSRTMVAVGTRTDPDEPADVVRYDLRAGEAPVQLTRVHEDVLGRIRLGQLEELWYTSSGGTRVQGWLVKPPNFDPSRRYPLIMEIHGGPHGMYGVGFNYMFQNFAANGYLVLYTNPRGSTGYGSQFGNAIERAYPSVDYDDLMAGVDDVVRRGWVDTTRMYVGGCSGGGVLSSWVIGHTDRFAAAAVRCPVINWLSFAGQTDIPYFTYNFFDRPFWEDPSAWLRQSSLMYVGNVRTPTMLMTGELDLRTPMPQTEEYFAALRYRNVPSVLLRFAGEYHGTGSKPSNFMRTQLYMMSWYGRWQRGADGVPVSARAP